MIKELVIKKIVDYAIKSLTPFVKDLGAKILTSEKDFENAITYHLQSIKSWTEEVNFNELKRPKFVSDIYVDLNLYVFPRKQRINHTDAIETLRLDNIFKDSCHFILQGQPGAGKTTSMKFLCKELLTNETFYPEKFRFPVLIKFRDFDIDRTTSSSSFLIEEIGSILNVQTDILPRKQALTEPEMRRIREKIILQMLDELNVLLILDGFDELSDKKLKQEALRDIRRCAEQLSSSTMILTTRTGEFNYSINNCIKYEICPLSRDQIVLFAKKWLVYDDKADNFVTSIYNSPFADTAIRPLTLAHLCAIYEKVGKIPDKPKTVYKRIVNLLLDEWDEQRSVKRNSKYANFETDRKFDFLCQLAFALTTTFQKTVFSSRDILSIYNDIHSDYDLNLSEAQQVVSEIESHTGLLLQCGHEAYEFAHKSLQEYLTAEYLVKLPIIPESVKILSAMPNELAIAVTISSNPSIYFMELVTSRFEKMKLSLEFIKIFLNRLFVEKPDFNYSPRLSLALVGYYSIYVESHMLNARQLKLFYNDPIVKEFEIIVNRSLTKFCPDILHTHYKNDGSLPLDDGNEIVILKKIRSSVKDPMLSGKDLNPKLYIRKSILDMLEKQKGQIQVQNKGS